MWYCSAASPPTPILYVDWWVLGSAKPPGLRGGEEGATHTLPTRRLSSTFGDCFLRYFVFKSLVSTQCCRFPNGIKVIPPKRKIVRMELKDLSNENGCVFYLERELWFRDNSIFAGKRQGKIDVLLGKLSTFSKWDCHREQVVRCCARACETNSVDVRGRHPASDITITMSFAFHQHVAQLMTRCRGHANHVHGHCGRNECSYGAARWGVCTCD